MIWAATYAADWVRQYGDVNVGLRLNRSETESIENAWAAVAEAREAVEPVREGFGQGSEVFLMLTEML